MCDQPAVLNTSLADFLREMDTLSEDLWLPRVHRAGIRRLASLQQSMRALIQLDAIKSSLESIEMEDSMNDADDEYIIQDLLRSLNELANTIRESEPIAVERIFAHLDHNQLLPTLLQIAQSVQSSNSASISTCIADMALSAFASDRGLQMLAVYFTQPLVLSQWRTALQSASLQSDAERLYEALWHTSVAVHATLDPPNLVPLLSVVAGLSGHFALATPDAASVLAMTRSLKPGMAGLVSGLLL